MKQNGKLYGMLIMALCLAAATAISLACLGKASDMSRTAYAQDIGLPYVQSLADMAIRDRGLDGVPSDSFVSYFDRDMEPCDEDAARYGIYARYGTDDGYFYEGSIRLLDLKNDKALIELPVAWTGIETVRGEAVQE